MLAARRGKKTRLAARGSTPGGKTRFFSWRQNRLMPRELAVSVLKKTSAESS
jgi:hypothetical protein